MRKFLLISNVILIALLPLSFILFVLLTFVSGSVLSNNIDSCYAGGMDYCPNQMTVGDSGSTIFLWGFYPMAVICGLAFVPTIVNIILKISRKSQKKSTLHTT